MALSTPKPPVDGGRVAAGFVSLPKSLLGLMGSALLLLLLLAPRRQQGWSSARWRSPVSLLTCLLTAKTLKPLCF